MEREDNFRLKRFKELKTKKNKHGDATYDHCNCDKKPDKGDHFVCAACKKEEENRNKSKKNSCGIKFKTHIPEVIGDKPSTLSTANQKCLDELTAHLEIVISLTNQCKSAGLVSPSADTFVYACKEIRCKIEDIEQQINPCKTNSAQTSDNARCNYCEDGKVKRQTETASTTCDTYKGHKVYVIENQESKNVPCNVSDKSTNTTDQDVSRQTCVNNAEDDSLGYYETKYKEIVRVVKFRNEDGTINEERQVITIKTERKNPHKSNEFFGQPCCRIDSFDSGTGLDIRNDTTCCTHVKSPTSQSTPSATQPEHTYFRSCVSDTNYDRNKTLKSCMVNDTKASSESNVGCACFSLNKNSKSKIQEVTSNNICCNEKYPSKTCISDSSEQSSKSVCCNTECPSQTETKKYEFCEKSSKKSSSVLCECSSKTESSTSKTSKKSVSCECNVTTKTACGEPVWQDACNSTSDLAERYEESEEECICVEESDPVEPEDKTRESCCYKIDEKKKSNLTFCDQICGKSKDDLRDTETCSKCNAKKEKRFNSREYSHCTPHDDVEPKCPSCVVKNYEIQSSYEKCLHCAARSKAQSSSGKCPHCAAKSEVKSTRPKCAHCALKREVQSTPPKCAHCGKKSELQSRPGKSAHYAERSEAGSSSGKFLHYAAKSEVQSCPGKLPNLNGINEIETERAKPSCKIRIVSKQGDAADARESVQEFVYSGNIHDALTKILQSSESELNFRNNYNLEGGGINRDTNSFTSANSSKPNKSALKSSNKVSVQSQSSPHYGRSDEKSVKMFEDKSQSLDNVYYRQHDSNLSVSVSPGEVSTTTPAATKLCPTCGGELEPYCATCDELAPMELNDDLDNSDDNLSCKESKFKQARKLCAVHNKEYDEETKCSTKILKYSQSSPVLGSIEKENKSQDSLCSEPTVKLCCDSQEISQKDASTETRRSDRYDVRPLKWRKSIKKLVCSCHSDSILHQSNRVQEPKRCKSYSGCCNHHCCDQ